MQIWPGDPYPLGLRFDGSGANVAVHAPAATQVELCLFDDTGAEARGDLPEVLGGVWHGYLPQVTPGTRYGFRVHGPFSPRDGLLNNPAKLLLDPYALAVEGTVTDYDACRTVAPDGVSPDPRDSAPYTPRSVVVSPFFDWAGDAGPGIAVPELVVYEVHVKGATMRHPGVPVDLRGTYQGLTSEAFLAHLARLGVNAVELLPVHASLPEAFLVAGGLTNYWGYNSIGWFAPHAGYASQQAAGHAVGEFRSMVRELHRHGIAVLLDVVYNHTAEGLPTGPTVCLRGFDPGYYRSEPGDATRYIDFTGTGNTLDMRNPFALQIVMDSLRYWVTEMHVDGFRFDLASTLAREDHAVDRIGAFFDLVQQDPVLRRAVLIAEPWDCGDGGYQVGNFPTQWLEWNGRYRDTMRDYWRGTPGLLPEVATRMAGSADLYAQDGRTPFASVNFITAHDGFTMRDLVSYDTKHNLANLSGNRDGTDDNRSWNSGVEGPTDDPAVLDLRRRRHRAMLTTLLLGTGTPMLAAGDELGRTQQGNNNAYCQDNEVSWIDWSAPEEDLAEFTAGLLRLRAANAVFRRRRFFSGTGSSDSPTPDLQWFAPSGSVMADADWGAGYAKALAYYLNGDLVPSRDRRGVPQVSDSFYLCLNADPDTLDFTLPGPAYGPQWTVVVDTATGYADLPPDAHNEPGVAAYLPGARVSVAGFGVVVLCRPRHLAEPAGTR